MSSLEDLVLAAAAAGAAATVTTMVVTQTDQIARRIMAPDRLDTKRHTEYKYHWETAMEKAHLQLSYYLAGGQQKFLADNEIVFKKTDYISSDHDMEGLVHRILKEKESKFITLKIDKDPHDPTGDLYLYLMADIPTRGTVPDIIQVPLAAFTEKLARAFRGQPTTTTFCFAADASSGKACTLLERLVRESKSGVAVMSESLWMVKLAHLVQANAFEEVTLQTVFFALCRLDAWSLRSESGDARTVLVTFPGQCTVSSLLPVAQQTFPTHRHVFSYDSCAVSTQRGMAARKSHKRGAIVHFLDGIIHGMCNNPIRHTIPFLTNTPLTKTLSELDTKLAHLTVSQAQGVESWMNSVDTFYKLKSEANENGYSPYVFKTTFLTQPDDQDFTPKSDSHWILSSLLQHITGTSPIPEGVMDSAIEFLKDFNRDNPEPSMFFSESQKKCIEECVNQHKSIISGDKELLDTVIPVARKESG